MIKKYITMLNLYIRPDGNKKAKYLKKKKYFIELEIIVITTQE